LRQVSEIGEPPLLPENLNGIPGRTIETHDDHWSRLFEILLAFATGCYEQHEQSDHPAADPRSSHGRQSISHYNSWIVWWSKIMIGGCLLAWTGIGCGPGTIPGETQDASVSDRTDEIEIDMGPLVIFLGDSLTAGYGLSEAEAYPDLLAERLAAMGRPARIVNAGISGDTTAGGLTRVDWLLSQDPDVVVVELGANDGLRGLSLVETEQNLDGIIRRCLEAGAKVLLMGMKIPPSYGPGYSTDFAALYGQLAAAHGIALMPFLLEGIAADPDLNQADGIHPNAAGQRRLAENVMPYLEVILRDL